MNNPSSPVGQACWGTSLRLGAQEEEEAVRVGTLCVTRSKAELLLLLPLKTCTAISCYLSRLRQQTNRNKCKLPGSISFVINSGRAESRARPGVPYGASRLLERLASPNHGTPSSLHQCDFRFSYRCLGTFAIKTSLFNRGKPPQNINDHCDLQIKCIHWRTGELGVGISK